MSGPSPEYRAFVEAGIGVVMSVIMADGKYTRDEFTWFKTKQHTHPLFRDVPPDAFNDMLSRVKARLTTQPWRGLVDQWAAAVPQQFKTPVFELAAELAVIDKELQGAETEVIEYLWKALGIPDEEARKIFMGKIGSM